MSDASVTGPVVGGSHGWAFGASVRDLAEVGYVEDEWFVEGDATTYDFAPGTEAADDGRWNTVAVGSVPYRTRFLSLRPASPARGNGILIVNWNNVSAGMDLSGMDDREFFDGGYAMLAVTTQAVGVHGYTSAPMGLRDWDEERYGSLSIPTDDASYDIFADVARLARSGALHEIGALQGFDVEHVVAMGGSQSAARLHSFLNGVAPHAPLFDAFVLTVHFGRGTPLNMGGAGPTPSIMELNDPPYTFRAHHTRLRTDLGVAIMVFNSETEVRDYGSARQDDDDRFRLWEVAGASHASGASQQLERMFARDLGGARPSVAAAGGPPANDLDRAPVMSVFYRHLRPWLVDGTPPPSLPRIELDESGAIRRDEHGIAMGGIRLPDVEVPLATLTAETGVEGLGGLGGARHDFDEATIRKLYPSRDDYLARYDAAIDAGVRAGFVLEPDAADLRRGAGTGATARLNLALERRDCCRLDIDADFSARYRRSLVRRHGEGEAS